MSDFNPKPILISAIGIYGPTSGGVAISRLPGDDLKLSNFNATWSRVGLSVCVMVIRLSCDSIESEEEV